MKTDFFRRRPINQKGGLAVFAWKSDLVCWTYQKYTHFTYENQRNIFVKVTLSINSTGQWRCGLSLAPQGKTLALVVATRPAERQNSPVRGFAPLCAKECWVRFARRCTEPDVWHKQRQQCIVFLQHPQRVVFRRCWPATPGSVGNCDTTDFLHQKTTERGSVRLPCMLPPFALLPLPLHFSSTCLRSFERSHCGYPISWSSLKLKTFVALLVARASMKKRHDTANDMTVNHRKLQCDDELRPQSMMYLFFRTANRSRLEWTYKILGQEHQLCIAAALFLYLLFKGFSVDLITSDPVTVTGQERAKSDVGPVRRVFNGVRALVRVRWNSSASIVIIPVAIFRNVVLIVPRHVHVASLWSSLFGQLFPEYCDKRDC